MKENAARQLYKMRIHIIYFCTHARTHKFQVNSCLTLLARHSRTRSTHTHTRTRGRTRSTHKVEIEQRRVHVTAHPANRWKASRRRGRRLFSRETLSSVVHGVCCRCRRHRRRCADVASLRNKTGVRACVHVRACIVVGHVANPWAI